MKKIKVYTVIAHNNQFCFDFTKPLKKSKLTILAFQNVMGPGKY